MNVFVSTVTPAFSNDILDIVRVFFGAVQTADEQDAALRIAHTEKMTAEGVACEADVSGVFSEHAARAYAPCQDALEDKRLHKRALKLAVYDALKRGTGRTPPWGALTGIRPTRILYAEMEKGATLSKARARAKAVFDVSDEKLDLLCEIIEAQRALPPARQAETDLYIGIPFCVTRCAYCSFLSGELGDGKLAAPYTDALLHEISLARALLTDAKLTVKNVYIGGGTPTALPEKQLARVLSAVAPLAEGREFTVEAGRPDTITREKLALIQAAGATRISINPQTFHDETLRLIGRAHTTRQTLDAYALARAMGFHNINMDLIAGLPGEDEEMFTKTLSKARALSPESLTVHTLAIKRSSLLHLWGAALPEGALAARMVDLGRACAHQMGMTAYYLYRQKYMAGNQENVGYALPGHASDYNVRMMEETGHVIALGAGAISKRVFPTGGKILRAPNVGNIEEYIARVDEMAARKRALWLADGAKDGMDENVVASNAKILYTKL